MQISIHDLEAKIRTRFKASLPGINAHRVMAPYRSTSISDAKGKKTVRSAATIMLLYPKEAGIHFVLIQRPIYNGIHGGQISFPGGKQEMNELLSQTAKRETEEEIGVPLGTIQIIGKLTEVYIPPSAMLVSPFVGLLKTQPIFTKNDKEVDEVIEVPLEDLFRDKAIKKKKQVIGKGTENPIEILIPYYSLNNKMIWGATAVILSEFKEMMKDEL